MPENYLYEYAVIRLVPIVEREEFINIGMILFSKRASYIKMDFVWDEKRLDFLYEDLDKEIIYKTLCAYQKISEGQTEGGVIAGFDIAERFRWLTAVRSTCIQTSRPHSGLSNNLELTFSDLFKQYVL